MTSSLAAALAVVAVAGPAFAAGSAHAQVSPVPALGLAGDFWTEAIAVGPGNVLYVGGSNRVAMRTGHWVRVDALGVRDPAWPDVDGSVDAVTPDGGGAWFIGGRFSHVARQPRAALAHVGAGGELDPTWAPAVELPDDDISSVRALCLVGETLYVSGEFTAIDRQRRRGLAALDVSTHRLLPWDPQLNGSAVALAAASGRLFMGGSFTRVGSVACRRLAAFDTATGALTAWDPGISGYQSSNDWAKVFVSALAV